MTIFRRNVSYRTRLSIILQRECVHFFVHINFISLTVIDYCSGNVMSTREGLNVGEQVRSSTAASFQSIDTLPNGYQREILTRGMLVLTQNGVVFIESKGVLSTKFVRHHSYDYDSIGAVRTESRGFTGSLTGEEFLVLDIDDPGNVLTLKYSCKKDECLRLKKIIADKLALKSSIEGFEKELIRQVKPVTEVDLRDVAKTRAVRDSLARILNRTDLTKTIVLNAVIDKVRELIADGLLDGVIDSSGVYSSKLSLSRKSVQYQVAIDFNSLFTQLKGKGIVLESLECPSCKGSLQYPEAGSVISCTFCGATVSAVDVFEKFKGLLDV